jgi:glycosyltransferase involved in cell wall biosynthesis
MKIFYHFIMDPRSGGPHQFVNNFIHVTKNKIKNKIIINGKKKNDIHLSFYRNNRRFLYLFEVIINLTKIYLFFKQKQKLNKNIVINIHGFYNFAPLFFSIFSKKKINWFIHEEIKKKYFFIFEIMGRKFNIFFLYDFNLIGIKKKSNFFIIKPSIDTNFWSIKKIKFYKNTFINVGNLNPLKNHNLLLNAASKIKYTIKIFIAGGRLYSHKTYYSNILRSKKRIEKKSKTKIFLLGKLSKELIKKNLSLSEFFIMSSKSEGTPFALLEAMSCKKICIIPKIKTLSKIFTNGFNGFYFKDNNVQSLSAVLVKVINLKKRNKTMIQKRARKLVLERFSNKIFKKNIEKHFIYNYD